MASTYEKSVKGATKVKLAAPKSKYIEHLLMATQVGAVDQVFRPLGFRLKDSTWTIVFKGLIVAHIMIRDGAKDVSLRYLAEQPRYFSTSHISSAIVSEQGENIRDYSRYLQIRVQTWRELKYDYASQRPNSEQMGRLKKLSVEKGLLREAEGVSRLTGALLKCKFFLGDLSNDITLTAFRLLVSDLLALFQPLNEAVMNVLGRYFEMSRTDAERSLRIYKQFVERTNEVIEYLSEAKSLEHAMRLQVPNAPTGLTNALEEYLNDPDFENNRRQYLEGRDRGKSFSAPPAASGSTSTETNTASTETKPAQPVRPDPTNPFNSLTNRQPSVAAANSPQNKQNLIDFFASIESEQTSMFPTPPPQQQQFAPQSQVYANPSFNPAFTPQPTTQFPPPTANQQFYQPPPQHQFTPGQQYTTPQQPIRPEWTGAGFGGYTPSSAGSPVHIMPTISSAPPAAQSQFSPPGASAPQTQFSPPVQNSGLQADRNSTGTTNPFRASMLPHANTFPSDQGTNPFASGQRAQTGIPSALSQTSFNTSQTSFASVPPQQQPQQTTYQQPFQPQPQPSFPQPPAQQPQQPIFQQSNQSQPVFTPQAPVQVSSSTGTNPFSRPQQIQSQAARLTPQVTGSNPFRSSILPGGASTTSTTTNGFGWSQ